MTLEDSTGQHVDAYFGRLDAAFGNAVGNAVRTGELAADTDVDELAAFFTMALLGIATLAKGRAQPTQIEAATRVAMTVLDANAA